MDHTLKTILIVILIIGGLFAVGYIGFQHGYNDAMEEQISQDAAEQAVASVEINEDALKTIRNLVEQDKIDGARELAVEHMAVAIWNDNINMVNAILDIDGIDLLNVQTDMGTWPHIAIIWNKPLIFDRLRERGADIDIHDRNRESPLHTAIKYGRLDIARIIIEDDPENVKVINDANGMTTMHYAANPFLNLFDEFDIEGMVKLLVKYGGRDLINQKNYNKINYPNDWRQGIEACINGQTPLELAMENGHTDAAMVLMKEYLQYSVAF